MLPLVGSFPSTFLMGDLGFDGKTLEVPNHGVPAFVWGESLSYWDRLNRDRSFCYHYYKQSCVCCVFIVFVTVFILYNFNTMFFFPSFFAFFSQCFFVQTVPNPFFFHPEQIGGKFQDFYGKKKRRSGGLCPTHPSRTGEHAANASLVGFSCEGWGLRVRWVWQVLKRKFTLFTTFN